MDVGITSYAAGLPSSFIVSSSFELPFDFFLQMTYPMHPRSTTTATDAEMIIIPAVAMLLVQTSELVKTGDSTEAPYSFRIWHVMPSEFASSEASIESD